MTVKVLPKFIEYYTRKWHKKLPVFIKNKEYNVHAIHGSQDVGGFVVLVNEYKELWWVENQHVRVVSEIF